MLVVLKAACLAIYGLALAGLACFLPNKLSHTMQVTASVFLVIHAIELVFTSRKVRLYRGSLAVSALLTILFGLLHWLPLTDAKALKK
ncbi:hypothetical protein AWB68_07029 [Caballeronia choica]|jgi:uncharacterized protein YhhL (DUF1145 family)|uniref:DUF1145 domain-containing protein n=1 Tax=Caballeronia choica TaxID=326476 RepID=A0A158KRL0_9BURK|nr:hypothetical protein [Caballeronia choica]SAL83747.1 hypothetical protein AWB68_07029 [Caballeronia choica]